MGPIRRRLGALRARVGRREAPTGRLAAPLHGVVAGRRQRSFRLTSDVRDVAARHGELAPAGPAVGAVCPDLDGLRDAAVLPCPPLRFGVLEHVEVDPAVTAALVGGRLLVSHAAAAPDSDLREKLIVGSGRGRAVVDRSRPTASVTAGLFLGGTFPGNFGHWLVQLLPRIAVAQGLGGPGSRALPDDLAALPVLVPPHVREPGPFRDSLALFVDPDAAVPLASGTTTHVDRMVWVDPPWPVRPRGRGGGLTGDPDRPVHGPHAAALRAFRDAVRARTGARTAVEPGLRLYLARGDDPTVRSGRSHNEDELVAVARRHGFRPVVLSAMPLADQVDLVARAECLTGTIGAAWTHLLFAAPAATGVMVVPSQWATMRFYAPLAAIAGVDLRVHTWPSHYRSVTELMKSPFRVDPEGYAAALARVLDAAPAAADPGDRA